MNTLKILLALLIAGVAFAAKPKPDDATVCSEKYFGVKAEWHGVNSPALLEAVLPLTLKLVAQENAAEVTLELQGTGAFSSVSLNRRWSDLSTGDAREVSIPLAVTAGEEFGSLRLRLTFRAKGAVAQVKNSELNGYIAGGKLYYGTESAIELQQHFIAELEAAGAISNEEANQRRAELTTLRQFVTLSSIPEASRAKSPTDALTITGQVQWKDHSGDGGTGGLFPVIGMNLMAVDAANPNVVLASAVTDRQGRYTLRIAVNAVNASANPFTLRLKATAQSTGFSITSPGPGAVYTFEKDIANVVNQASVTANAAAFNITFDQIEGAVATNIQAQNRVWGLYSAMFLLKEFCDASTELRNPPNLPCEFPVGGDASYFSSGSGSIYILSGDYADFDVTFHEYGHFIQNRFTLTSVPGDPPGSGHSSTQDLITRYNKAKGIRMAWSEGMATAIGMAIETAGRYGLMIAPRFGNQTYDDSEDSTISYPAETEGSRPNISEGNEATVFRILFDLFDGGSGESFDVVSWGIETLMKNLKDSDAFDLDAFWDFIVKKAPSSLTPADSTAVTFVHRTVLDQYAPIFAKDNVAPDPISPKNKAELDAFAGNTVTFKWKQNINTVRGAMKFRVLFLKTSGQVVKTSDEVNGTAGSIQQQAVVPKALIQDAKTAAGANEPLFWTVAGIDTAMPQTGVYVGPPLPLDAGGRILFVIDDTGSMGNEIGAVKQGLINFLNRFDTNSTSTRFQLMTFKDNVTPRASTTSLNEIKNQVSTLFASGGDDTPEASVEALWVAALILAAEGSGGTVFLATDAPPHSGLSIPATIAVLRAAGIRVNIILTESGFSKDSDAVEHLQQEIAAKTNGTDGEPPGDVISTEDLSSLFPDRLTLGTAAGSADAYGSTDIYGSIADATGGTLIGLSKNDTARIAAAVENLTASGIFPAIVQVIPRSAPAGATLDVTIEAQNSNFDDGSTVSFSRDVTVNSVTRISPVEIAANITIASGAAVGSIDVSVRTGGEQSTGVKVFDITAATTAPTTLSVSPSTATRGETVHVTINGLNTNFRSNSVVRFTSTVTSSNLIGVVNLVATSSNRLEADLIISNAAPASFYSVTVDGVTRSQAFRVSSTVAMEAAGITAITPNRISQGTSKQQITILGQDTSFTDASRLAFSGTGVTVGKVTFISSTQVVAEVSVSSTAPPGFRDVFVNTGPNSVIGLQKLQVVQPPDKLTVRVSGSGKVSPALNGRVLIIGKSYAAVARPNKGFIFNSWTGDVVTNVAALRFIMRSNMLLQANFVPNPFTPVKGTYVGLFYPGAVDPINSGYFSITLSDQGGVKGTLALAGKTHPIGGQANGSGRATITVTRPGNSTLTVQLVFDLIGGSDVVTGTVTDGAWVAVLSGDRTALPAAAAYSGTYNALIPGDADPTTKPGGDGALMARVDTKGGAQISGNLGDGARVLEKTSVSKGGRSPFYASLYAGEGVAIGWLRFRTNDPIDQLTSDNINWVKHAVAGDKYYPAGFARVTILFGSRYTPTSAAANILGWNNGTVVIGGGNLTGVLSNRVEVTSNKITVLDGNPNKLSLTIVLPTGRLMGSFEHPVTMKQTKISGVLLPVRQIGGSWFLGTDQSGYLVIGPGN